MKTLELNQMEILTGGTNPEAVTCGMGVAIATFGWALLGPVALLGLALCLKGDS